MISSLNVNDVPVPTAFAGYVASRLDQAAEPEVFVGGRSGSHRVTFSYSPPHLDWAIAAFILGCAALGLQLAPLRRARARFTSTVESA